MLPTQFSSARDFSTLRSATCFRGRPCPQGRFDVVDTRSNLLAMSNPLHRMLACHCKRTAGVDLATPLLAFAKGLQLTPEAQTAISKDVRQLQTQRDELVSAIATANPTTFAALQAALTR